MWLVLTVSLPLFGLILAGYVAARRGLIDGPGIRGMTGFVFYFALPLMLFHLMATAPLAEDFDGRFILAFLSAAFASHLLAMAVARLVYRRGLGELALAGFAASFGNTVFIALPIALELFGPRAALPMALLVTMENGIVMPFTVALLEIARTRGTGSGGSWRALATALGAVPRNPIVLATLSGAAVALTDIALPALLVSLIELVRGAVVPCALFAMGATLAAFPVTEKLGETALMVALKLIVYPLLVLGAMSLVPDLDPLWMLLALLTASMPIGANVYLMAVRYEIFVARASTAVLVSTLISVASVTALAAYLTARLGA